MSNTPNNAGKDVIYIDVDDEITAIIDKVRSSEQRIVALVLPKRATMMQSIVNMKLLKRTSDAAKKHLVLITSEASLLPLAGTVGIYVAKTPQSRPEIPAGMSGHPGDDGEEAPVNMAEPMLDKAKPISAYTGAAAIDGSLATSEDESIQMEDEPTGSPSVDGSADSKGPKPKKDRKLAIPDFNKFRLWLVLGGVGVVLLVFLSYLAFAVMPKATVSVKTDSTAVDANLDVIFDTTATEPELDDALVPAKLQKTTKTASQTVDATGSVNKGEKATGQITITNCSDDDVTIPAGTGFSGNGMTFISKSTANVPASLLQPKTLKCANNGKATVSVTAQKAGASYNLADGQTYSVANAPTGVTAVGGQMTGGTDNIVKIVSQNDLDSAKQKIAAQDADAIELELQDAIVNQGKFAIRDSFTAQGDPEVTTTVAVGAEADSVGVTQKTTYTMLAADSDDLKKIIAEEVKDKIDEKRQSILDYGLDEATFKMQGQSDETSKAAMSVTAVAGSDLNLDDIKKAIAGKKANDVKELIKSYPGVTEVNVKYSPFWVSSTPKKVSKITLTVEQPKASDAQN